MRRNWRHEVLGHQEVGLDVGAKQREDRGPRRYLGARKCVPLGVWVPGSFVVPGSVFVPGREWP